MTGVVASTGSIRARLREETKLTGKALTAKVNEYLESIAKARAKAIADTRAALAKATITSSAKTANGTWRVYAHEG